MMLRSGGRRGENLVAQRQRDQGTVLHWHHRLCRLQAEEPHYREEFKNRLVTATRHRTTRHLGPCVRETDMTMPPGYVTAASPDNYRSRRR
jgi:hypothetical protein